MDGIWQHIHTVTTTDVSPDLGEFAEIIDDVNMKIIHHSEYQRGWYYALLYLYLYLYNNCLVKVRYPLPAAAPSHCKEK